MYSPLESFPGCQMRTFSSSRSLFKKKNQNVKQIHAYWHIKAFGWRSEAKSTLGYFSRGECWLIGIFLQRCWTWHPDDPFCDDIFSSYLLFIQRHLTMTIKKYNHRYLYCAPLMTCHEIIISGKMVLFTHSPILSQWEDLYLLLFIKFHGQSIRLVCLFLLVSSVFSDVHHTFFNKYWSRAYIMPETTVDKAVNKTDKVSTHTFYKDDRSSNKYK